VTYAMDWMHRPDLESTRESCDRELAEQLLNER
jgi:hypothetical protein